MYSNLENTMRYPPFGYAASFKILKQSINPKRGVAETEADGGNRKERCGKGGRKEGD